MFIIALAGNTLAEDMLHDEGTHGGAMKETVHGEHQANAQKHGAMDHANHKSVYSIKTKAVIGDSKLLDAFSYTVK